MAALRPQSRCCFNKRTPESGEETPEKLAPEILAMPTGYTWGQVEVWGKWAAT